MDDTNEFNDHNDLEDQSVPDAGANKLEVSDANILEDFDANDAKILEDIPERARPRTRLNSRVVTYRPSAPSRKFRFSSQKISSSLSRSSTYGQNMG